MDLGLSEEADGKAAETIGVVGTGTMGSGIAQLALLAGANVLLFDPSEEALTYGAEHIRANLEKGAQANRWTQEEADYAADRLKTSAALSELRDAQLVIEAAPESLELKRELFARLSEIVADECVLATNTSSLSVTAIASAAHHPERVVGMHFFNPPILMRLVEIVAGELSNDSAVALAQATAQAMGKETIRSRDLPGFVVNRCARPFALEALRLLEEGIATAEQIDRICRLGGGFPMGPFELMDLVGIDVGLAVSKSFFEQSFGEPRWQPSQIQARMAAAGRLGRKSGRGYYDYGDGPHRPEDPEPPEFGDGEGLVVVAGDGVLAQELRTMAADAGYKAILPRELGGQLPLLIVDCGAAEDDPPLEGGPQTILCVDGSLASLDPGGTAVGFSLLPPADEPKLVELTKGPYTTEPACERTAHFFNTLGKGVEWVGDAPGLVLGRIISQLINEAAFALQEEVATAEDIDRGTELGLNFPHGPLHWSDRIGVDHVIAILEALVHENHPTRYRIAPRLAHQSWTGKLGRHTGEGFFDYEDIW